ncbi:hypothetical protein DMR_29090 [Solidesulfovibrio magneticus RS-1]|uniref:Uncharacterized protein n=1 Tax=Solidesulfovibrio magneticus (strain ATCC 700980 / DSM 13731 / RS-1) TaxID=573370 RepID=C4XHM6_SOLM1|nr:hypothetical protein DMR_29090 [Solidesulfovibrio magneticus RS-1]
MGTGGQLAAGPGVSPNLVPVSKTLHFRGWLSGNIRVRQEKKPQHGEAHWGRGGSRIRRGGIEW